MYPKKTLDEVHARLRECAKPYPVDLLCYQSNQEGELVDFIQKHGFDAQGLILNPAAYTHSSIAIRDAVLATEIVCIEVHVSNIYQREAFRQQSYYHDISKGVILGFGAYGYELAFWAMLDLWKIQND